MGEKLDDVLGLSLSLSLGGCGGVNQSSPTAPSPLKVNHMMEKAPQSVHNRNNKASSWNDLFHHLPPTGTGTDRSSGTRSFLGGIDMNSAPLPPKPATVPDCDDDNGDNSTVSSSSGKRSEREEDNNAAGAAAELASCSPGSDDEDGGGGDGDTPRKKLRLTKEQSLLLEETFKQHNTLNTKQKQALAKELNLRPRQVEVWFQNRRARTKLKQTEVDCEYLKRCCENLSEENRRLHKEVQELRALNLSPQLYMQMNPPTTLTMCPSCERVTVSSSASSSSATGAHFVPLPPGNCSKMLGPNNIRRPVPVNPWPFEGSISRP